MGRYIWQAIETGNKGARQGKGETKDKWDTVSGICVFGCGEGNLEKEKCIFTIDPPPSLFILGSQFLIHSKWKRNSHSFGMDGLDGNGASLYGVNIYGVFSLPPFCLFHMMRNSSCFGRGAKSHKEEFHTCLAALCQYQGAQACRLRNMGLCGFEGPILSCLLQVRLQESSKSPFKLKF